MAIRMSAEELKQLGIDGSKPAKYHSEKMVLDGITFDSKKEASRYAELKLMKKAHIITEFKLQPEFILQDGYVRNGKNVLPIKYRGDFEVMYPDGRLVVIDVKGMKTKEYRIKKKMLLYQYPYLEFVEE